MKEDVFPVWLDKALEGKREEVRDPDAVTASLRRVPLQHVQPGEEAESDPPEKMRALQSRCIIL